MEEVNTICQRACAKEAQSLPHPPPPPSQIPSINQPPLMADIQPSHLKSSDTSQHQEQQPISPQQTLGNNSLEDDDDDDVVNVNDADEAPYIFNLDPLSPLNSSFFVPASSSSYHHDRNSIPCSCCSSESDSADSTVYPDCLYGRDEEYDQMDYITDLFDSRSQIQHNSARFSTTDVGISVSEGAADHHNYADFVSNDFEELGLGLGHQGGLRVARIESDSDTEELGLVSEHNDDTTQTQSTDFNLEHTDRDDERDVSSVIEEISVSSDGEATVGVLEWEILLAVNNLERDLEFASDIGGEGFVYTPEFDTLIGQFVETVRALRGGPPAAKSIIDNLPLVALEIGDVKEDGNVICAVCKDEIAMGEEVTRLPCKHYYHGQCIVPWLSIRNTCPVCRFELPTDDVDYERSKNRVNDDDGELRVGYGLHLSH